jgi:hypothetical protein
MWAEDKNVDVKAYMTFLIVYVISRDFFYEGPSHHSLKAFCATPMMMIDG